MFRKKNKEASPDNVSDSKDSKNSTSFSRKLLKWGAIIGGTAAALLIGAGFAKAAFPNAFKKFQDNIGTPLTNLGGRGARAAQNAQNRWRSESARNANMRVKGATEASLKNANLAKTGAENAVKAGAAKEGAESLIKSSGAAAKTGMESGFKAAEAKSTYSPILPPSEVKAKVEGSVKGGPPPAP